MPMSGQVDEVGHLPLASEAAVALFHVISRVSEEIHHLDDQ